MAALPSLNLSKMVGLYLTVLSLINFQTPRPSLVLCLKRYNAPEVKQNPNRNGFSGFKSVDNNETQTLAQILILATSTRHTIHSLREWRMVEGRGVFVPQMFVTLSSTSCLQEYVLPFTFQLDSTKAKLDIEVWSTRSRAAIFGDIHRLRRHR